MSKADEYKKHSDKVNFMFDENRQNSVSARVLQDGTLYLQFPRAEFSMGGLRPEAALALGKWIVDHYEEKPTASLSVGVLGGVSFQRPE